MRGYLEPGASTSTVTSGAIGDGAVLSGNIGSGQVADPHFASGAKIDAAEWLMDDTFISAEPISGAGALVAVGFTQSGTLWTAMASVSGRMPAVGVVTTNYLSGTSVNFYHKGRIFAPSVSFSGFPNQAIYVGSSGAVVSISGVPVLSGNIQQKLGVVINGSGVFLGEIS